MAGKAPRKRRRRSAKLRNSLRLGGVLAVLTAVNVYVFCFRSDTAVKTLLAPSSMSRPLTGSGAAGGAGKDAVMGAASAPGGTSEAPVAGPAGVQPEASGRDINGVIGANDTLGSVLARESFGPHAGNVIAALGKLVDLKAIHAGEAYSVSLDEAGAPDAFEYRPTPALRYIVTRGDDGVWQSRKEEKPLVTKVENAAGVVESSLYESVHRAGQNSALVALLVDLFAWDINFYVDTHPGDTWKVVVERQYLGGDAYKYGRVLAAEYSGKVGTFRAFYYAPGPKMPGRYYDEKGQAIAKTLLKCPLRFVRISSKFDPRRLHPVLHVTKAHMGVDYAAPIGTPVWASASGRVAECESKRGSGNTVVLNHGNGLATRYYHLSRFAKGLKVGQYVKQKDIIGFVGTTGLSTGPHLHFGMTRNGTFVDPLKVPMAREAPVGDKGGFQATIRPRLAALKALQPTVAKN